MSKVTIELTEEQLEAIKKTGILDEKGDWFEPKQGEEYWLLNLTGISWCKQGATLFDHHALKRQVVFRTEAEARKADRWRIALTAIRKYIAGRMPFKPDWSDENQYKYSVCWDAFTKKLGHTVCYVGHGDSLNLYLSSSENTYQLIKDQEQNLKILFGVE